MAKVHYVDNRKFLIALIQHRRARNHAKIRGVDPPLVSEYIGECFLKIGTHLSFKPNFANYTYREDMVSDGVENCLVYMHNFNPRKSRNPFGYFTSVIYYAFVRRIQRERRHTYLRYKLIEEAVIAGDTRTSQSATGEYHVDSSMLSFDNVQEFIRRFDDYTDRARARRKLAKKKSTTAALA